MFKVVSEPTFTHPVTAKVPIDGGFREEKFKATFKVIEPGEADKFDLMTADGSTGFLKQVVIGLDELGDAEGQKIEFSDDVFNAVLKLPWARKALATAYFSAISGAKAGN